MGEKREWRVVWEWTIDNYVGTMPFTFGERTRIYQRLFAARRFAAWKKDSKPPRAAYLDQDKPRLSVRLESRLVGEWEEAE